MTRGVPLLSPVVTVVISSNVGHTMGDTSPHALAPIPAARRGRQAVSNNYVIFI